jgi:hypothetical protein
VGGGYFGYRREEIWTRKERFVKTIVTIALAAVVAAMVVGTAVFTEGTPSYTAAERMALRVDAVLDGMTEPEFNAEDISPYWQYEIAPFFEYEGFTNGEFSPPEVVWEPQISGIEHNHLLGYTYCEDEVFLNIRAINPISSWYGWARNPIATLTHEMIHTLGGDFCNPWDSETTESTTQTATLETLAAIANGGNEAAFYSLMLELRDTAMDVVLSDALARDDLDSYREFLGQVIPGAKESARFEKSMRHWAGDMLTLQSILDKYSVLVFNNAQAGVVVVDLPGGDWERSTVALDDLTYILTNMVDMADDFQVAPPQ